MKKVVSIISAISALLVLLLVTALPAAAQGSTVLSLRTASSSVRVGDTVTITGNFDSTQTIGIFDLSIKYDPGLLEYQSASGISPTITAGELDVVPSSGSIQLFWYDSDGGATGITSADAFTVSFAVVGGNTGDSVPVEAQIKTVGDANAESMAASVKTVSMTIAAPLSGNAYLSGLTVSNADISPAFDKEVTSYSASVPFSVEKLDISAAAEDGSSKVSVNSPALTPNGTTAATVTVTAQNGAKRTYTIKVTRAQDPNYQPSGNNNLAGITVDLGILSPVFSANITKYVVWLPYEVANIQVAGTPEDDKASVTVEGGSNLSAGADNTITVTCAAENGDKKRYTVIAKRAAGDADTAVSQAGAIDTNEIIQKLSAAGKSESAETVIVDLRAVSVRQLDTLVFNALAENKNVRLNIQMDGAQITFKGADIQQQDIQQTFDFTYTIGSDYADTMAMAIGDESGIFTYSFAYHGNLPGYATFDIDTEFISGQKVNVYRYDPDSQTYTLIAEKVTVSAGGIVSYVNNTCSDYVITPSSIANAQIAASVSKQAAADSDYTRGLIILFGVSMLGLGIAMGFFLKTLLLKRKAGM